MHEEADRARTMCRVGHVGTQRAVGAAQIMLRLMGGLALLSELKTYVTRARGQREAVALRTPA